MICLALIHLSLYFNMINVWDTEQETLWETERGSFKEGYINGGTCVEIVKDRP